MANIGDIVSGGTVFYTWDGGLHGLIAAQNDIYPEFSYWGDTGVTTGASDTGITYGYQNTITISGTSLINNIVTSYSGISAWLCGDLNLSGYTDWYLPSKGELIELYNQKDVIGGDFQLSFSNVWPSSYFSSTEEGPDRAFAIKFSNGYSANDFKWKSKYGIPTHRVRPIRQFGVGLIITTSEITNITSYSAQGGGNVTSDGGLEVTEKGICYSTSPNPTILDTRNLDGTGIGTFIIELISLTQNTIYFVRAYAINSMGIGYGNEISFTTLS